MVRRREVPRHEDPFVVLGLPNEPTVGEIENARRALAKSAHPDVGGSHAAMQRINAAADEATRIVAGRVVTAPPAQATHRPPSPSTGAMPFQWRADHPSFTVEALPAESFEALYVVATWLGETIDDDPPYRLDVELTEPVACWCRLELLPDAGATTVGLMIGSERGVTAVDVDTVRDAWVAGLNSLDWDEIGDSRRQP